MPSMKISDILTAPWAIEPSKLIELHAIYQAHVRGEAIDIEAVEKRLGRPLANEQRGYDVVDGVAVLPIEGVIAKKMNMFSQISGGASSQLARRSLLDAVDDPAVHSVILSIDSPGGTVDGTQMLADTVFDARTDKPIVTLASGTIASAAYWFGSAASKVYLADTTTSAGSIGIVGAHVDVSAQEAARGIKTTEITAGKYKRIASQYAPLSEDGRQSIQDQLDYMYSLFVGAVAKNRGVNTDVVLSDMADGRVFIGQQAIDAGLVDGIITLDALVEQLNRERGISGRSPTPTRAGHARTTSTTTQGSLMNKEELEAQHPALAAELRADGAKAERERIKAIEDQTIAGHEALITSLKFDGKSTAGDAALAVLAAEKTARAAHAKATAKDAPKPVVVTPPANGGVPAAASKDEKSREQLDKEAKEYMASNPGTSYIAAYKAVGGQ
jgi:signal peptide peptidase SppA